MSIYKEITEKKNTLNIFFLINLFGTCCFVMFHVARDPKSWLAREFIIITMKENEQRKGS